MKLEGFRVPSKIGFVIRGFSRVCANPVKSMLKRHDFLQLKKFIRNTQNGYQSFRNWNISAEYSLHFPTFILRETKKHEIF